MARTLIVISQPVKLQIHSSVFDHPSKMQNFRGEITIFAMKNQISTLRYR